LVVFSLRIRSRITEWAIFETGTGCVGLVELSKNRHVSPLGHTIRTPTKQSFFTPECFFAYCGSVNITFFQVDKSK